MSRKIELSILLILLLSISSVSYAAIQVTSLHIADHPAKTRIVVDLKGQGEALVSTLKHPGRIVLRFPDAKKGLRYTRKQIRSRWIKRIRTGWGKKGYLVVLDLKASVKFDVMRLPARGGKPSRLVIDLYASPVKVAEKTDKPSPHSKLKPVASTAKHQKRIPVAKETPAKIFKKKQLHAHKKTYAAPVKSLAQRTLDKHQHQEKLKKQLLDLTARPMADNELVVAIDAGHGGKDTGAIGLKGVREKDVTLAIARQLKRMIDAEPGMRAVLVREADYFIPLERRPEIAKRKGADLFISIHADAFPHDRRVRGGTIFVLNREGASSAMAKFLARSENRSLFVDSANKKQVAFVLGDLVRNANLRASKELGHSVLKHMAQKVRMHKLSVQSANFAVLRNLEMPAILIETAFISNPQDVRNLRSRRFQKTLASSILAGLKQFAAKRANKHLWGERLFVYYKVERGDNLSAIAAQFGVKTSKLKKLNHLRDANLLYAGKRLKIPVSDKLLASL